MFYLISAWRANQFNPILQSHVNGKTGELLLDFIEEFILIGHQTLPHLIIMEEHFSDEYSGRTYVSSSSSAVGMDDWLLISTVVI